MATPTPTSSSAFTQVKYLPFADAAKFDFSWTNGSGVTGNLSSSGAGKVLTFAFLPSGMAVNGYVYLTGGVGTAEAVLITSVSGNAGFPGTITVTTGNPHTQAWSVRSATGGVNEARQSIVADGGHGIVYISAPATFYQGVYSSSASERILFQGACLSGIAVTRGNSYAAGDLFHQTHGVWQFQDLAISNPGGLAHTGAAIYSTSNVVTDNVVIYNGQYGIRLVSANSSGFRGTFYVNTDMSFKAVAGISLEGLCGNITISDSSFVGAPVSNTNVASNGMRIIGVDGLLVSNTVVSGDYGILFSPNLNFVTNVRFSNLMLDQWRTFGISFSSPLPMNNIRFSNSHIHGQSDGATTGLANGVYLDPTSTATDDIQFDSTLIAGSAIEGVQVLLPGMKSLTFSNCSIIDNNRSNTAATAGIKLAGGVTGIILAGCTIGNVTASGHQKYGIAGAGALGAIIATNNLTNNETAPMTVAGAFTGVLANNNGIDSAIGTVASGASVALPLNPTITISGTTGVGTVTGLWEGRKVTLITTDGSVTFTAGATIGNTVTSTQNKPLNCSVNGGKIYLS